MAARRSGYQTTTNNAAANKRVAAAAVLSALGLAVAATPLVRVYLHDYEADERTRVSGAVLVGGGIVEPSFGRAPETALVVDLADNASAADVAEINARFGLSLRANSVVFAENKVTRALLPPVKDVAQTLAALRADPRVEAAETEQAFTIPEGALLAGPQPGVTSAAQAASDAETLLQQAQAASERVIERAGGRVEPFNGVEDSSIDATSITEVTEDADPGSPNGVLDFVSPAERIGRGNSVSTDVVPDVVPVAELSASAPAATLYVNHVKVENFTVDGSGLWNFDASSRRHSAACPASHFGACPAPTHFTPEYNCVCSSHAAYDAPPAEPGMACFSDGVSRSAITAYSPALFGTYGTRPNDPRYDEQWNFTMVGAEDAWKRSRGKGVVVAVIDTGVAAKTTGRGKQGRDFGSTTFTDGYDFVHDDNDPYDDHGHGTHVAGTIAESTNNNEGVAGLAFEATIMPLKVLSAQGSGSSADIADAIRWAADHGAHVINMSLGSPYPSEVIHKAVKYARKKNVTVVCAAGNGFGEPVGYPAAFAECIAISSVGPTGEIATYSSYGKEVALAAPGGDMMQSGEARDGILQNTVWAEEAGGKGDDYYAFQGTSMASPHAAAVAALVVAQGVTDPARVRDVLVKTAQSKGEKIKYGAGILNAGNATKVASQEMGGKLRYPVYYGLVCLLLFSGGGLLGLRSLRTRLFMAVALGAGFFGADILAAHVGADSAWNFAGFSVLAPLALVAAFWNRSGTPGVAGLKIAGALALGVFVNLFANWHNGTIPFTTATFGAAALPWTAINLGAALVLANMAGWRAVRRAAPPVDGKTSDWV